MSEVKRYANVYFKGSGGHHVIESPDGEYVSFEDYEALLLAARALLQFGHPEPSLAMEGQLLAWCGLNVIAQGDKP